MAAGGLKKSRQMDMTRGSIGRNLILFAVPFLIGNLFQEFYTIVDSMIVGNFCNASALAAIGSAENPSKILLNVFLGFGTGTTILISRYFGAGDEKNMALVTRTSNALLLYLTIPLAIVGALLARTVLTWIRVEEGETMGNAVVYMQILMLGTPAMMGYNQNAGILRGLGDSRSPLLFLVISCIVNVVLDLLFVGPLHMGVAGAGAATVLAQGISWICSIFYIKRVYPGLDYRALSFRMDRRHLREILRIGIPLGVNNSVFSLGHTIVAGVINGYGTNAMAGYTCAKRLDSLTVMPVLSIGNATTSYVAQNAGAKQWDRIQKGIRMGCLLALVSNVTISAVLLIFRREFLGAFNGDPEVIAFGVAYVVRTLPFYALYTIFNTLNCAMNGANEVLVPTVSSMVMFWVVRLPLMVILSKYYSLEIVYWAFPISWAVGLLISGTYYLSGRWKKHLKIEAS